MASSENTKVVIKSSDGMYFGGDGKAWRFSNDVYGAVLFDEDQEQVEATLSFLRGVTNLSLEAVPLRLHEVFETCDRCQQMIIPIMAFFDGKEFLCPDCKLHPLTS